MKKHCLGTRCPTQFDPENPCRAYNCQSVDICPYADPVTDKEMYYMGFLSFCIYMFTKDQYGEEFAEKFFKNSVEYQKNKEKNNDP